MKLSIDVTIRSKCVTQEEEIYVFILIVHSYYCSDVSTLKSLYWFQFLLNSTLQPVVIKVSREELWHQISHFALQTLYYFFKTSENFISCIRGVISNSTKQAAERFQQCSMWNKYVTQIHQTDYMSGMGNGHTLEISGKSFSQGKKKPQKPLKNA